MKQEDLKELAHQLACPEGDQGLVLGEKMNKTNAFIIERSIQALDPKLGEHILEIGFGNGELSMPIIETIGENGHYIGVEKSSVLAQQASELFNQNGITHVTVISNDCHSIKIKNNTLDGILAINVLYFIDDIGMFFRKNYDFLKSRGRMVIAIRSSDSLQEMPFTQFSFKIRSLDLIKHELRDAGFINVESDYFNEGVTQFENLKLPIDSLIIRSYKN